MQTEIYEQALLMLETIQAVCSSPDVFEAAAAAAAAVIDPLEDVNTNAEYRRDLIRA